MEFAGLRNRRKRQRKRRNRFFPAPLMKVRGVFFTEVSMPKISDEVKDFLKNRLCFVATVDSKGMPNLVAKGDIAALDEEHLIFADLYAHQTKKNLIKNPNVAVSVVNPASYRGYQFKGKAEIIERGKIYDLLARQITDGGQLNHPDAKYAVKIKVDKIIDIGYGETADMEI